MYGTLLVIFMAACGYLNVTLWVLVPGAFLAGVLTLEYPSGKDATKKDRYRYWIGVIGFLPLQALLLALPYGVGKLVNALLG